MKRAVAEEITNEFFEKLKRKEKDVVELAERINRMVKVDDEYQNSLLEGMKSILEHMKNGGTVKCIELTTEAGSNEIFKDLLKKYNVPYVSAVAGKGKTENIFYKDKDTKIVSMCRLELMNLLNYMCEEISPRDLLRKHLNDEIKAINGLDTGDIEFIRREIAERNDNNSEIDYSVVKDIKNQGKEMIMFPENKRAEIEKIVDKVIYEFSGTDGKEKKKEVLEQIKEEHKFENIINNNVNNGKTVCLVDSVNPNVFCLINENGIFMHKLTKEKSGMTTEGSIYNIKDDMIKHNDRRALSRFTASMYKPVIMSLKEVSFIKGIDSDGQIKTDKYSYEEDLEIMKSKVRILPQQRKYEVDEKINDIRNRGMNDPEIDIEKQKEANEKIRAYKENMITVSRADNIENLYVEPDKKITVSRNRDTLEI